MKTKKIATATHNYKTQKREPNDFYATDPKAMEELLKLEKFNTKVWECACGQGHLSEVLKKHNYQVKSTDLIDRGYGEGNIDFLQSTESFEGDIISNPPYFCTQEFVEHALELVPEGNRVAMFLRLAFLEGQKRDEFYQKYPPELIYVSSSRVQCAKDGDFEKYKKKNSTTVYAWYIWRKGFDGEMKVRRFN